MFESLNWEYGNYYQSKYIWQYVNHNFESPMYYLSYAASGIVALQIWSVSQKDYPKAVRMWEDIEKAGPYDFGYFELLDNLDIKTFDDKANVVQICMDALNRIHELNP
jgi:oligoendopeptidase F